MRSVAAVTSTMDTARRVLTSSWFVIAVGIWLQCCTGSTYDFSIYSESIKESLGYDQEQLDSISFSKDIGANVGVISGLLYGIWPPWTILGIAGLLGFVGNLMMWLSITARIETPSLWLACLYALLAANSQTFSNTAVVVTCVKIFPTSRGTVVGLMKGCLGLSGAVLVQLYYATYGTDAKSFPLLMAWLVPIVCLSVMFVIRPMPAVQTGNHKKWLNMFSVIVLFLAVYLFGVIILENCISIERSWKIAIFGGIILICTFPTWVVIKAEHESVSHSSETDGLLSNAAADKGVLSCLEQNIDENPPQEEAAGRNVPSHNLVEVDCQNATGMLESYTIQKRIQPKRGGNFSLLQAMLSLDFWLLFVASACGMGSGVTTINNMSQLGSSLDYTDSEITSIVSLWSIWNFFGRFGGGYISEHFFQSRGIARPLFMVITLAAMVFGHIIIAMDFPAALYTGPVLVGICYGAQWSLVPTIASEIFGLKSFGAVFNTITVASPLSSYVLSVKVIGYLYDLEAEKGSSRWHISQVTHEWSSFVSESSCYGAHCFRLSFFIMAGVCMIGSLISIVLLLRTRIFYKERFTQFKVSEHG